MKQPQKNLDIWRIFTYRITLVSYFYNFTDRNCNRNVSNVRTSKHQVITTVEHEERHLSINLSKRKGKMHPFGVVLPAT